MDYLWIALLMETATGLAVDITHCGVILFEAKFTSFPLQEGLKKSDNLYWEFNSGAPSSKNKRNIICCHIKHTYLLLIWRHIGQLRILGMHVQKMNAMGGPTTQRFKIA